MISQDPYLVLIPLVGHCRLFVLLTFITMSLSPIVYLFSSYMCFGLGKDGQFPRSLH